MAFNGPAYGAAKGLINGVTTGLVSTSQNADGTVNVTYADGNTYTTPNIKGDTGADGHTPTTAEITAIVTPIVTAQIGGALNGSY